MAIEIGMQRAVIIRDCATCAVSWSPQLCDILYPVAAHADRAIVVLVSSAGAVKIVLVSIRYRLVRGACKSLKNNTGE